MTGIVEVTCPTCEDTWHYLGTTDDARTECRDCGSSLSVEATEAIPA